MIEKVVGHEFMRAMSFMRPRMGIYLTGMLVMSSLVISLNIVEAYALKSIMDAAVDSNHDLLIQGIMTLLIGIITVSILRPFFRYFYNSRARMTAAAVRLHVFDHVMKLPIGYFERFHSGDTIARLTTDTNTLVDIYTHKLRRFVAPIIYGGGAAIAMLWLDWRIALVLIILNALSTYINIRFAKPIRRISDHLQWSMGTMTEKSIDLLAGFSVMKLFHLEEMMLEAYDGVNNRAASLSVERRHWEGMLDSANYLLSMISNVGAVIVGAYLVARNITEFGTLLALINLQSNLSRSFLRAASYLPQIQESLAGGARVFELLDEVPEPERYKLPASTANEAEVALTDVVFGYQDGHTILDGITLQAKPGEIIALVGPSGGGKSTVFKLLLGFYPPQAGQIIIQQQSLGSYTLTELRDRIAYVSQDAYLFDGTIIENIRYGRLDATDDEVAAAAIAAYAHDFILEQAEGYQTHVGERGTKLSGGQRQRIAIARALLRDAPVLLLDEATSALDSQSEQWVQKGLKALMENRTTIVIAHRLSTIQPADMIYVIDRGRIVEQGKHGSLIAQAGLYKLLYETQFLSESEEVKAIP